MNMLNFASEVGKGSKVFEEAGADGAQGGGGAPSIPAPQAQPAPTQPEQPAPKAPQPSEPNAPQEAPTGDTEGPTPVAYEETGDPALDYVLGYVGNMGLTPEHPAMQAAMNGEFDLLGVELAKADAKGAANILALAQKSYENYAKQSQEEATKTQAKVFAIAGGPEQWAEVAGWASDNASEEERTAINTLFEQGGVAAEIAAKYVTDMYREASGTAFEGAPAANVKAPAAPASSAEPITRQEFAAQAQKLYNKYGDAYVQRPEYRNLAARLQ